MSRRRSFLFFGGAALPWIYPLGTALVRFGPTTVVDIRAGIPGRCRSHWPFDDRPPGFHRQTWVYPPGFNGTFAGLFNGLIRRRLTRLEERMAARTGSRPHVVIPNPRYAPYVASSGEYLVYRSYDEFGLYQRDGSRAENPLEPAVVDRAGTVICSSAFQTRILQERFPGRARQIHHVPHGVHESFIPSGYTQPRAGRVLVAGSLTARYNWELIRDVARRLPEVEFLFVGTIGLGHVGAERGWETQMRAALGEPNVEHRTGIPYRDTAPLYWSAEMSWMPYRTDLRFVQAACPVKLTDGLASGRPLVSTDVPEARLYEDRISIHMTAEEAVEQVSEILGREPDAARCAFEEQIAFASSNTWAARAERIVELLPD